MVQVYRFALSLCALVVLGTACAEERQGTETLPPPSGPPPVVPAATVTTATAEEPSATVARRRRRATTVATVSTEPPAAPTTAAPPPTTAPPTTAPPTAPATTAAPADPPTQVALQRNGFSTVEFGTGADEAVAEVSQSLGAPSEDTGWVDPLSISSCAGTTVRRVTWGDLSLLLGDQSPVASGTRHFFAWSYGDVSGPGQPGFATPEGIGPGDSVAELRAAYPGVVVSPGEEGLIDATFYVDDGLSGVLTGDDDGDSVSVIFGGQFCG
jgi:hypothetical protein